MPLTPTPGSAALAAGFTLVPGTGLAADIEEYINRLADEVAGKLQAIWAIANGGTGSSSAAGARANLDVPKASATVVNLSDGVNAIQLRWELSRAVLKIDASDQGQLAYVSDVNSAAGQRVAKTGDTMSGDLFLPNSSAASSGWTTAYINGDGRVSRGASSLRYKKNVTPFDPLGLGNIWPVFQRYRMRADSGLPNDGEMPADPSWHYGYIVEEMIQDPDQAPFVVWREVNGANVPDAFDEVGLLKAQAAQLHARAIAAEAKVEELSDTVRTLLERMDALEVATLAASTPPPADPPTVMAPADSDDPEEGSDG